MNAIAIIPARYASTRFPGKPLALLNRKPIIQHVYERALSSELFSYVAVATDDPRIADAVSAFGGKYHLTSDKHQSGTDRIAEVASALDIPADVIVNIQGDEPLITKDVLHPLISLFADPGVQMASLMTPLSQPEQLSDPNAVKVVTALNGKALYFSRATIPYDRDGAQNIPYYRHIGVYAYRPETLQTFVRLTPSRYELIEKLEQLRALENGIPIHMVETDYQGLGVDTPEDLLRVEAYLTTI